MGHYVEVGGIYTYKGKKYLVTRYATDGSFLTKDSDSGNWSNAVEYRPVYDTAEELAAAGNGHHTYVRTEDDFANKFERVR